MNPKERMPDGTVDRAISPNHHHHHHYHQSKPGKVLPPDVIDLMDDTTLLRHHSGPFDAVTKSAYLSKDKSPLAALEKSTEQILKATPEISIRDSLNQHVPLQNIAVVAPGQTIPGGLPDEVLDYKEENLIGDVGRWDGIEYDDDDRRAKGHPGWDGAFMGRGRNEAERAKRDAKKKDQWQQSLTDGNEYNGEDGELVEMVPRDRDIRVDGMKASAAAIEEAESHKKLGVVDNMMDGIKRRLSARRPKIE
jgi:hypothetical protein